MKKALMVTEYFPPAPGPATARIGSFCRFLPEFGWQPTILTPSRTRVAGLGSCAGDGETGRHGDTETRRHGDGRDATRRAVRGPVSVSPCLPVSVSPCLSAVALAAIDRLFLTSQVLPPWVRPPLPDGWTVDWFCSALREIVAVARRLRPDVIYATAPPMTAHVAAALAAKRMGVPLVLDFRDLWCDNPGYAAPPAVAAFHRRCERRLLRQADGVVVNTPGAHAVLRTRHAGVPELARKMWVIPNGFCGEDFGLRIADCGLRIGDGPDGASAVGSSVRPLFRNPQSAIRIPEGGFRLRFVGKLYGDFGCNYWDAELVRRRGLTGWRAPRASDLLPGALGCLNPVGVFEALQDLRDAGELATGELRVEFIGNYGAGNARLARELGLEEIVRFHGTVDARSALEAIRGADALLLLSSGAAHVVPAKSYEYLAAGTPLLVIAPPGDVPRLLRTAGATWFGAHPDDRESIRAALTALRDHLRAGTPAPSARPEFLARYDRRRQTARLAHVLDDAAGLRIADCGLRIGEREQSAAMHATISLARCASESDTRLLRNPQSAIRNPQSPGGS